MTPRPAFVATDPLERLARRRAGAKLGWYLHASVYLLVNLVLAALALASGRTWHLYPLASWGPGAGAARRRRVAGGAGCRPARASGRARTGVDGASVQPRGPIAVVAITAPHDRPGRTRLDSVMTSEPT